MACVNSSLVLWSEREILPRGMFLTCSGSGGDRILFWQTSPSLTHLGPGHDKSKNSTSNNLSFKLSNHNTTENSKCGKDSSIPHPNSENESKSKPGHNPFALNLILDPCSFDSDASLGGNNQVPGSTCSGFTSSDRPSGLASTIPSNLSVNQSLMNNATNSLNFGFKMNVGGSNTFLDDPCFTNRLNEASTNAHVTVSSSGISSIGGIPTNLLLSLLHHQRNQALQSKIYTKLDRNIFIGSTFNLTPCGSEMTATHDIYSTRPIFSQSDLESANLDSEIAQTYHSTLSFAIVFLMDMASPPSVLSHYTELARLIGSQIRRAELVSGYLNKQREIITSIWEQTYANCTSWDNINPLPVKTWTENLRCSTAATSTTTQHGCRSKRTCRPSPLCMNKELSPNASNDPDFGPSKIPNSDKEDLQEKNNSLVPNSLSTLDNLAKHSTLCAELKFIVESVCKTGHVNAQINGLYPVFFCLPHKAYGLIDQIGSPTPAIRPSAVWRAMERIRPYHSLVLCLRKDQLLRSYLPADVNPILIEFIQNLTPTTSLLNISQQMNTQNHCLNLALWLIYRGHAFIVYPIVANNVYVLSPHSTAWFTPQLIAQFAATFPQVNFAELLASFSTGFSLKDCSTMDEIGSNLKSNGDGILDLPKKAEPTGTISTLTGLSFEKKVELVTWLLRRRLIMQVHLYVFANFSHFQTSTDRTNSNQTSDFDENRTSSSDSESTCSKESLPSTCICKKASDYTLDDLNQSPLVAAKSVLDNSTSGMNLDETMLDVIRLSNETSYSIPRELLCKLSSNLPQKNRQLILADILNNFNSIGNISLLDLFARILTHLPSHFEELMFAENVDRHTLTECIEQFNKFLLTARIPDPVTACFAGVPWCD